VAPTDVGVAEDWAEALEVSTARRLGVSRTEARPVVARKAGVPQGKLYSLSRRRLKDISNTMLRRIGAALIRDLQAELARVQHELQTHTQIGSRPDGGEVFSLVARREKIREALGLTDTAVGIAGDAIETDETEAST
jgi:hypothetical protein